MVDLYCNGQAATREHIYQIKCNSRIIKPPYFGSSFSMSTMNSSLAEERFLMSHHLLKKKTQDFDNLYHLLPTFLTNPSEPPVIISQPDLLAVQIIL